MKTLEQITAETDSWINERDSLRLRSYRTVTADDILAYAKFYSVLALSRDLHGYEMAYYITNAEKNDDGTFEVWHDEDWRYHGEYIGDVVDGPLCGDCVHRESEERDDIVYYVALQCNGEIESGYEQEEERPRCLNCDRLIVERDEDSE